MSRGNEKVMPINASRSEINMGSASTLLQQVLWQFNGCCSILLCDATKPKPCGTVPELVLQISVQTKGYLPSLPCTNHLLATVLANLYYVSGVCWSTCLPSNKQHLKKALAGHGGAKRSSAGQGYLPSQRIAPALGNPLEKPCTNAVQNKTIQILNYHLSSMP